MEPEFEEYNIGEKWYVSIVGFRGLVGVEIKEKTVLTILVEPFSHEGQATRYDRLGINFIEKLEDK